MNDSSSTFSYTEYPSAGIFRRLVSMVYDALVVIALWFLIAFIYLGITGVNEERSARELQLTLFPFLLTGTFFFYYWFWSRGGQTLGMRAWRLQVVDAHLDGRPPNILQCLSRFLMAILSLSCFGLGYLWIYVSPSRDTWHDSLSNTRTLVLPKDINKKVLPAKR